MIKNEPVKEEIRLVKKIKVSHLFKMDIDTVWNFMKDISVTYKINCLHQSAAVFTKGKNSYTVNSQYYFFWRNKFKHNVTILDCKEKEDYKRLVHHVYREYDDTNFTVNFRLYKVRSENKFTLFEMEYFYEGKGILRSKCELNQLIDTLKEMFSLSEKFLFTSRTKTYTQVTFYNYNIKPTLLFPIVADWRLFHKFVPEICSTVTYQGSCDSLGSIMTLSWSDSKFCKFVVIKFSKEDHEIHFKSVDSNPKIPQQEIQLKVVNSDGKSFLEFKHVFADGVDNQQILRVSKNKEKILSVLATTIDKVMKIYQTKKLSN